MEKSSLLAYIHVDLSLSNFIPEVRREDKCVNDNTKHQQLTKQNKKAIVE